MSSVVLDASALLAVLRGEPGADYVVPRLRGALISAVNVSEVIKRTMEKGDNPAIAKSHLNSFWITVIPFDESQAVAAAELSQATKPLGLSLADRACLGLGKLRQIKVLTADKRWQQVELGVEVELIR